MQDSFTFTLISAEEVLGSWTCMGVSYFRRMGEWKEMGRRCSQRTGGCRFCEPYEQWLLWSFRSWLGGWVPRYMFMFMFLSLEGMNPYPVFKKMWIIISGNGCIDHESVWHINTLLRNGSCSFFSYSVFCDPHSDIWQKCLKSPSRIPDKSSR
jgi:hypothetical protein